MMIVKHSEIFNPVKIESGISSFEKILNSLSGNWLLLTSKGNTKRGFTERYMDISKKFINLTVYDEIKPNPEIEDLEELTNIFRSKNINGLIAIGGGSVIDSAKVLSVTIPNNSKLGLTKILRNNLEPCWEFSIPLIAVPTTAGTGAEVTPFAAVWDKKTNKKYSVSDNLIYPEFAILDPELTKTLPYEHTLFPGLDAISQALESMWNKNSIPETENYAWKSLSYSCKSLPIILKDPSNIEHRELMLYASLMSGLAISKTKTAIAHSISYPLTSHYGVPHGLAASFTLPALINDNFDLAKKEEQKKILNKTLEFLESVDMKGLINKYLTNQELFSLMPEMISPGRADNYSKDFSLQDILEKSIN